MLLKFLRIKIILLVTIAILLLSGVNLAALYLFMPGALEESKTIIIKHNLSSREIAQRLFENGIIKYPKMFWLMAKIYSIKGSLKSGEYVFTARISPYQVLSVLNIGKSVIHKLVIPEGTMVSEILTKINSEERLLGEIKGNIPEGYLMPSTYFFSYGDHKEHLIEQMRKNMSVALDIVMSSLSPDSLLKTRSDVLILASIVEKETLLDQEKPLIAGVFLNRMKLGMRLQADPTTIYAVTEGKFKLQRPLSKKDLAILSPYNTYYVRGLPASAISCPGLKSLEAAVKPTKTKALYFVVNGSGGHNFSENLDDHNKNVNEYRKSAIK